MRKRKKLVFAGSFDPITTGHLHVIEKASELVDVIVLVAKNTDKNYLFSSVERFNFVQQVCKRFKNVFVTTSIFEGIVADYVLEYNFDGFIRGIRNSTDLEYEFNLAQTNKLLSKKDTLFIMADDKFKQISSSLVREIMGHTGELSEEIVPKVVRDFYLKEK